MKIIKNILLLVFVVAIATSQEPKADLESLSWLAGCWQMEAKGRTVSENWMKPAGKSMMSTSRTVKDGKTVEFEFVRLVQHEDGAIEYIARPSGQEGASFRLVKHEQHKLVFENLHHDFPQRIIYRLHSPDSLVARIEGIMNGKERGVDFPYRKVKCE